MSPEVLKDLRDKAKKFDWNDQNIAAFREKINDFKSFREKPITAENFSCICDICFYLIDNIPTPTIRIDVPFILRSRPNYDKSL